MRGACYKLYISAVLMMIVVGVVQEGVCMAECECNEAGVGVVVGS